MRLPQEWAIYLHIFTLTENTQTMESGLSTYDPRAETALPR